MEYHDYGCRRTTKKDIEFWREVYSDSETLKNMNSAPFIESCNKFWEYLNLNDRYVVFRMEKGMEIEPVGGFNIYHRENKETSFGFVIHPKFRGQGLGYVITNCLFDVAKDLGIKTLKADVYSDNMGSLTVLKKQGFREVTFLEKQL